MGRHLHTVNRAPISRHSLQAYRVLANELSAKPRPVVLDSFCGTGLSTAALAARYPGHLVIGIDKSAARLNKHTGEPADNCLLLQADCGEVWKLLAADGCKLDRHFLLYPNPWPKAKHLQRRIHGHHTFPLLLQLGGSLELRSNWQTYVEEFGMAMFLAGIRGGICRVPQDEQPITLFEKKYRESGHNLWAYSTRIMP